MKGKKTKRDERQRKLATALLLGSMGAVAAEPALAQELQRVSSDERVQFDIAAQPLSSALSEFARQARINALYFSGWSIALRGMPGTHAAGASGIRDTVDTHLGRIAVASLLSGALSVAANEAENDDSNRLTESVGNAAAQEAARVGGRIMDRELSVRPTLRIRAGAPVRVLVSQDIVLRPYRR
jgi:hypothetical protein